MIYNISNKIQLNISASNTKFNHTPIHNGGIIYYHKNAINTLDAYIPAVFF